MDNLSRLKEMINEHFNGQNVRVILFGSRARGNSRTSSDVDIAIVPYGKYNKHIIATLKEKIENSTIPYKVEIINLNEVSKEFKEEILKDSVIWKD